MTICHVPDARHNPAYLKNLLDGVVVFQQRYEAYLHLHSPAARITLAEPAIARKEHTPDEVVAQAARKVSSQAGLIAEVCSLTSAWIMVEGVGKVDPFANALSVVRFRPLLEPDDVLNACAFAEGRLTGLIARAEADAAPEVSTGSLHELVWSAARRSWNAGDYRRAVAAGAEAIIAQVKALTGRNDVDETDLWRQTFSLSAPEPDKPRLWWPGDPKKDRDVSTMRSGLLAFAPGVQMTIRNPSIHRIVEFDEHIALEQLCVLSTLARFVDGCELVEAGTETTPDPVTHNGPPP